MDIDAGIAVDQLIQSAQQCAAAGQHDAVIDDIGRQLGWSALKGLLDCIDHPMQRFVQRVPDLLAVDGDVLGQAINQIAGP